MADKTQTIFTVINGADKPAIAIKGYVGGFRTNSEDLYNAIKKMEKENIAECDVLINSGGGSTVDGLTIGEYLQGSSIKFNGIVVGMAASMAGVILQFCDTRSIYKYARVMTHKVKGYTGGEADQIRAYADLVDQEEVKIMDKFIERTGKDKKTVAKWMKSGIDYWMDAKKALQNNLVDTIIDNGKKIQTSNDTDLEEIVNTYQDNYTHAVAAYTTQDFNQNTHMKQLLVNALVGGGLISATENATDEGLIDVVNGLIEKSGKVTTMQAELTEFKKTQATSLIENACKQGKIPANEKEQWIADAVENFSLVSKSVERMAGITNPNNGLERQVTDKSGSDSPEAIKGKEDWDFDKWQQDDPAGLENLAENHSEEFNKLFNAKFTS